MLNVPGWASRFRRYFRYIIRTDCCHTLGDGLRLLFNLPKYSNNSAGRVLKLLWAWIPHWMPKQTSGWEEHGDFTLIKRSLFSLCTFLWGPPAYNLLLSSGHPLLQSTLKFCHPITKALPVSPGNSTTWRSAKPWGLGPRYYICRYDWSQASSGRLFAAGTHSSSWGRWTFSSWLSLNTTSNGITSLNVWRAGL